MCEYAALNAALHNIEKKKKEIHIKRRVRHSQGCVLSPCLFNLYTEHIFEAINSTNKGMKIGGKTITNMRYPDGTCRRIEEEDDIG